MFHTYLIDLLNSYCIDFKSLNRIVSPELTNIAHVSYRQPWIRDTYRIVVKMYRYTPTVHLSNRPGCHIIRKTLYQLVTVIVMKLQQGKDAFILMF